MSIFLGILAVSVAISLSFLDRIIEYFIPNGDLAKVKADTNGVILNSIRD